MHACGNPGVKAAAIRHWGGTVLQDVADDLRRSLRLRLEKQSRGTRHVR